ncbi:MAG: transglycosylase SLT domain-containing protein [Rubrivivax sp.]
MTPPSPLTAAPGPALRPRWRQASLALLCSAGLWLTGCATPMPPDPHPLPGAAPGSLAAVAVAATEPAAAAEPTTAATAALAAQAFPVGAGVNALERQALPPLASADGRGRLAGDDDPQADLWARVRAGYGLPDADNDLVRKWEQWYSSRPDYVQRMTERGGRYLFHIVEELQRREMPLDLALLPFIESAFNPQAQSRAAAAGMWQFMPLTGKDFDLAQNVFRDDRRDVLASTKAAMDYLQRLHGMFGDWHLALAAYNWGQGNVTRAMQRNQRAGLPTGYDHLRMPDETRNYVPKLQAVKNIVSRPADFGLTLPPLENHPFFVSVPIERDIDVALAARLAALTPDEFEQLNPQYKHPVILAAGTPQVLLPYDNANGFVRQLELHRGPLASWTAWVVPKTMSPADAAKQVGMSEAELREVNRIPARMVVKAGSTLLVPRGAANDDDVAEHIADNATMLLAPDGPRQRQIRFKAGRQGDSVASVAKRYGVSAAEVARWNKVSTTARFKAGAPITVLLANAPVRQAKAAPKAGTSQVANAKKAPAKKAKAGKATTRVAAAKGSASKRTTPPPKTSKPVRVAQGGAGGTR